MNRKASVTKKMFSYMNQTSSFNAILERARIDQTCQTISTMRYLEYCTNSEKIANKSFRL